MAVDITAEQGKMTVDRVHGRGPVIPSSHDQDTRNRNKLLVKLAAGAALAAAAIVGVKGSGVVGTNNHEGISPVGPTAAQKIDRAPSEAVVAELPSVYTQIRDRLGPATSAEAQSQLAFVDKLTHTDKAVSSLVSLMNSEKEADGTPTLVKLQMDKVANVDLSALYPNMSAELARKKYAEDQIFFLRDNKNLQGIKSSLDLAVMSGPQELSAKLKQYELVYGNAFVVDYSKIGTKFHQEGVLAVDVDKSLAGDAAKTGKVTEMVASVRSFLTNVPKIGDRRVTITAESTGEHKASSNTMEVGVDNADSLKLIAHEYGHSIDIENLNNLAPYLSAEEIYRLLVLKEKMLADNFQPKVERVFSNEKGVVSARAASGAKMTEREVGVLATVDIDKRLIADLGFLDTKVGAEAIREYGSSASRGVTYDSVNAFLASESANLNSLAAKNPEIKKLIADMTARPQLYDSYWASMYPGQDVVKSQKNWAFALEDMVKLGYLDSFYSGGVKADADLLGKMNGVVRQYSNEFTANNLGFGILYKARVSGGSSALGNYLSTLG